MLDEYTSLKTALLGAVVALVVYYVVKRVQFRMKYRLPPGPWAFPLVGNMLKFASRNSVEVMNDLKKRYGAVFSVWVGPYHSVCLNTLEVIDEALVKRAVDFAGRPSLPSIDRITMGGKDIALGDYGPVWRVQRKIAHVAMRSFTEGDKLTKYLLDNFDNMAKDWSSQGEPFDPLESITLFTYNILLSMSFGEVFEKDDPMFKDLLSYVEKAPEIFGNGFVSDFLPSIFQFLDREKLRGLDKIADLFIDLVSRKVEEHKKTFDPDNLRDLVDHILAVEEKAKNEEDSTAVGQLTDTHFLMILFDVFGAGTDTTRESLRFLLLYVGTHPDVQDKIFEELDSVVGRDRLPDNSDVHRLRYLEAVVFETMRCSSIVPFSVPHKTICDTTVGGYDVPKGSLVLINLLSLHNDPQHWTKPEVFNPDRFIDKDGDMVKSRAWMPFSGGRRVCPGESLAKRELTYIASLIFHKYRVEVSDAPDDVMQHCEEAIFFRIPNPYKMTVKERD